MHIATYFLETIKGKFNELQGASGGKSSNDLALSTLYDPELATTLANIPNLEEPDAKMLRNAAITLTKEEPTARELKALFDARDLIFEHHPDGDNRDVDYKLAKLFDDCQRALLAEILSPSEGSLRDGREMAAAEAATEELDTLS